MLSIKGYVILAAILTALAGSVAGVFFYMSGKIDRQADQIEELQQSKTDLEQKLVSIESDIERQQERQAVLTEAVNASRHEVKKVEAVFRGHDLDDLAKRKPALLERAMQNATRQAFTALETETK